MEKKLPISNIDNFFYNINKDKFNLKMKVLHLQVI